MAELGLEAGLEHLPKHWKKDGGHAAATGVGTTLPWSPLHRPARLPLLNVTCNLQRSPKAYSFRANVTLSKQANKYS